MMITYTETKDGALLIDSLSIPNSLSNRHYQEALKEIEAGNAIIDAWRGSQREADCLEELAVSGWKSSRELAVSNITVTVDGMLFYGDETSQNRMARAVSAADSDSETTVWVLANNTPAIVTALQLKRALKLAGMAQTALWVK